MRVVSITWARNEADILEAFVRQNSAVADHMIIVLHRTEDNSHAIADMLSDEGFSLDIRTDDSDAHKQAECLSALIHEVADTLNPDWILPLDADEFILSQNDSDPRTVLSELDTDSAYSVPWKTYVPTANDRLNEPDILKRICFRRENEHIAYSKVILPRSVAMHADVRLAAGNHSVIVGDAVLPAKQATDLVFAHFPVRSEAQLRRKILQGWESVTQLPDRAPDEAFHWKELAVRCADGRPIEQDELKDIALYYATNRTDAIELVYDPIPLSYDGIRYLQRCVHVSDFPYRIRPAESVQTADISEMPAYDPFIIFCHPRCGSSNLAHILSQHEHIHCCSEPFNIDNVWTQRYLALKLGLPANSFENPERMVQEFFRRCASYEKKTSIGFKIFKTHVPADLQLQWLLRPEHKIILLSRRNMLEAALSFQIAHRTKKYNLPPEETLALPEPFSLPVQLLADWIHTHRQWMCELRSLLMQEGKPFCEMTYEDMDSTAIEGICAFLGYEPLRHYENRFAKITRPEHYMRITNIHEIIDALACEENGFVKLPVTANTKTTGLR